MDEFDVTELTEMPDFLVGKQAYMAADDFRFVANHIVANAPEWEQKIVLVCRPNAVTGNIRPDKAPDFNSTIKSTPVVTAMRQQHVVFIPVLVRFDGRTRGLVCNHYVIVCVDCRAEARTITYWDPVGCDIRERALEASVQKLATEHGLELRVLRERMQYDTVNCSLYVLYFLESYLIHVFEGGGVFERVQRGSSADIHAAKQRITEKCQELVKAGRHRERTEGVANRKSFELAAKTREKAKESAQATAAAAAASSSSSSSSSSRAQPHPQIRPRPRPPRPPPHTATPPSSSTHTTAPSSAAPPAKQPARIPDPLHRPPLPHTAPFRWANSLKVPVLQPIPDYPMRLHELGVVKTGAHGTLPLRKTFDVDFPACFVHPQCDASFRIHVSKAKTDHPPQDVYLCTQCYIDPKIHELATGGRVYVGDIIPRDGLLRRVWGVATARGPPQPMPEGFVGLQDSNIVMAGPNDDVFIGLDFRLPSVDPSDFDSVYGAGMFKRLVVSARTAQNAMA